MDEFDSKQAFQLAVQQYRSGRYSDAEQLCRQVLARTPNEFAVLHLLGLIAQRTSRKEMAVEFLRHAAAIQPNRPEVQMDFAVALREAGFMDESVAACRRVAGLVPNSAEILSNLASTLAMQGNIDEAIDGFRRAISLNPNLAECHQNLGSTLLRAAQYQQAAAEFKKAIELQNGYADAHMGLGIALLASGDLAAGWPEYEWRLKCRDYLALGRNFRQPLWDGSPLDGRTILLHAEQGFGDTIQFIRYLPMVAARGGKIVLQCYKELGRLLAPICREENLVIFGQPRPHFDVHAPLLSLPYIFKTTLHDIPHSAAYLHADPQIAAKWKQRLAEHRTCFNVGIAWSARATQMDSRIRSLPLAILGPLAKTPGARFFSLQKSLSPGDAEDLATGMDIIDWTGDLVDFAETAGLVANLDLIISIDSAVLHLAGAMGKPAWGLLSFATGWRWLEQRQDSPWYSTVRLFRQSTRDDWEGVVNRVADELQVFVNQRA